MKIWKANIMLLLAAMFWGGGFVATDLVIQTISPVQMQTIRFSFAAIICLLLFHKQLLKAKKSSIIYGCIIGLVFFLAMTSQNYGLVITTVPKNAFITVTNVIWTPLIAFMLFRKKVQKTLWVGIVIMMVGFLILVFEIDIFNLRSSLASVSDLVHLNFGDFLTLISALLFALQYVLQDKFVSKEEPVVILTFQLLASSIFSLVSATAIHNSVFAIPLDSLKIVIIPIIFLVIFPTLLSFGFVLTAQKYVPASNTAIICATESLFATIFAIIIGNTPFALGLLIGGIIITIGIVYAETGFKKGTTDSKLMNNSST